MKKRKNHSSEFKAKVALEAQKGIRSIVEIGQEYQVHPNQVSKWKEEFKKNAYLVFEKEGPAKRDLIEKEKLYQVIGQLQVENDFLKKKLY